MTHDQFTILVEHRPLLDHLSSHPSFSDITTACNFGATHLILEECISYIFRHSGHSQDVIFTFLVSLDVDVIVEHDAFIPD